MSRDDHQQQPLPLPQREPLSPRARNIILWSLWGASLLVGGWLYIGSPHLNSVKGVAEVVEYNITSREVERILQVTVTPGQPVKKGDTVVLLDPGPLTRELDILAAELNQSQAELQDRLLEIERTALLEEGDLQGLVGRAEMDLLMERIRNEGDRARRDGLMSQIGRWEPLAKSRLVPDQPLEVLQIEAEVLQKTVTSRSRAIRDIESRLSKARESWEAYRAASPTLEGPRERLAPYQAAVAVFEARLKGLEEHRKALTLVAPEDGIVHRVLLREGDMSSPSLPILQIRAMRPHKVLAYLDDMQARAIRAGLPCRIYPLDGSGSHIKGHVESLGAGLAPFPEQIQSPLMVRQWGREIYISLEEDGLLVPGQPVEVILSTEGEGLFRND